MMKKILFLFLTAFTQAVFSQQFPTRPVKLVVGFTPGGGVDIAARTLAPKFSELIGQPVIVENKPGAGTNIANEFVARSAPRSMPGSRSATPSASWSTGCTSPTARR